LNTIKNQVQTIHLVNTSKQEREL